MEPVINLRVGRRPPIKKKHSEESNEQSYEDPSSDDLPVVNVYIFDLGDAVDNDERDRVEKAAETETITSTEHYPERSTRQARQERVKYHECDLIKWVHACKDFPKWDEHLFGKV